MDAEVSNKPLPSVTEKQIDRRLKPSRPNYKQIHALPLPIKIYPLPPLIPHNPFSILQIAFTYLLQIVAPPSSHPKTLYRGCLSLETRSVHILDDGTARALWEQGFFGKGSLSRSEPSWLDREKRKRGFALIETSEEVTGRRRAERKEFKKERARKERRAIEERLEEEAKGLAIKLNNQTYDSDPGHHSSATSRENHKLHEEDGLDLATSKRAKESRTKTLPEDSARNIPHANSSTEPSAKQTIINQEHLQLTFEEAFFLVYALGILKINDPTTSTPLSNPSLLSTFRQSSYFPPLSPLDLQPDDPFLLSYAVYHHFRSLGWVVRPGIKFAVDYLLYNRGPVFAHAEFATVVLPAYTNPYWTSTPALAARTRKIEAQNTWRWLHCVNRVQSQAHKSLVLVYVDVPPPIVVPTPLSIPPPRPILTSTPPSSAPLRLDSDSDSDSEIDITALLKQYQIRELTIKRWTPNRSRD